MAKYTFPITALFGLTAVALGAFGAHALKEHLSVYQMTIWEKGIYYQFFHTSVLLFMHLWNNQSPSKLKVRAIYIFLLGITCFSGSLYLLALKDIIPLPTMILGPITPLGGIFFLLGWGMLLYEAWKNNVK